MEIPRDRKRGRKGDRKGYRKDNEKKMTVQYISNTVHGDISQLSTHHSNTALLSMFQLATLVSIRTLSDSVHQDITSYLFILSLFKVYIHVHVCNCLHSSYMYMYMYI